MSLKIQLSFKKHFLDADLKQAPSALRKNIEILQDAGIHGNSRSAQGAFSLQKYPGELKREGFFAGRRKCR